MCRRFNPGSHHKPRLAIAGVYYFMYKVYLLLSIQSGKTYTGFTNDIERRLREHNVTETRGFTLRYRPWVLIHIEAFELKADAMAREKFYKSGKGREKIKEIVQLYLNNH